MTSLAISKVDDSRRASPFGTRRRALRRTLVAGGALLMAVLSGCVDTAPSSGAPSPKRIEAEVTRLYATTCMNTLGNLAATRRAAAQSGLEKVETNGGVTAYSHKDLPILVFVSDYTVTLSSGGGRLSQQSGYQCTVSSPALTTPRANAIVDAMRDTYVAGKASHVVGRDDGFANVSVDAALIGKPFHFGAAFEILPLEKPISLGTGPSAKLQLKALPMRSIFLNVVEAAK